MLDVPANNESIMNVWLEGDGKRRSREITSCLCATIKEHTVLKSSEELVLWSDSCGGQNGNITMVAFLLRMVFDDKLSVNKITHRIHESGHSFLPNDQDFGLIEQVKRQ